MSKEETRFEPLAASIRQTMNVAGKLMQDIGQAYPEVKQVAEVHRAAAADLEKIASDLKSSADEEVSVPLTCGFIGGYSNLLELLNKHLLRPVADLQRDGRSKDDLKMAAVAGINEIAKVFRRDADEIEKGG